MKITALLLSVLFFASLTSYSQITLNKKNAPLQEIFDEITIQAKFSVSYDKELLKRTNKVNINVVNASVKTILDICASQQPFQYRIDGNSAIIDFNEEQLLPNSPPVYVLKGRIVDLSGSPITDANIGIKNGNSIGKTDTNGDFVVNGIQPTSTLEFSHVGYDNKVVKLDNQKNLLITLGLQIKSMEEVVKNGYTSTPRKYEVGSIKKINFEEIPPQVGSNLFSAIQGRVPGMMITQKSGLPGSPYKVQIRGQRSIGITPNGQLPDNAPLFIVDGVPFLSSNETVAQKVLVLSNNPFSTLNPDDIESIEVLKDANATSVYGSLGANGVVLITTKKAKSGAASFNANIYSGFSSITRAFDYMNTEQYLEMRREAFKNDNELRDAGNAYDFLTWDTTRYNNWKELLIGGTAHISNGHIRFAGGTDFTQFVVSGGYNKETTVFPSDLGKSFASASFNLAHKSPNKKLEFTLSANYGFEKNKLLIKDPTDAIGTVPNSPNPLNENGSLNFGGPTEFPFLNNPFSYLRQPYNVTMERLTAGSKIEYKILPQLSVRTNAGYNLITCDEISQLPISSQDTRYFNTGSATFGNSRNRSWIIEPQVEFNDTMVGPGQLRVLAGSSLRSRTGSSNLLEGTGYTNDPGLNSIDNAAAINAFRDYNQYRVISAYSLLKYIFYHKYVLEASVRRDGSSRFGPNRKFGTFSSFGASWIFTNEKLMTNLNPILSFGKLRFTYGSSGNDQIGDYKFLDTWDNNPRYPYQTPTILPSRLANEDYQWEIQKSFDVGMDLKFFKNRVTLFATFNQGRTSNQLVAVRLPVQTGFNYVIKNFPAVTQNRNFEFELSSTNLNNADWKWSTSANISFLKNKLIKFPGLENTDYGKNRFRIGEPLNLVWGYRTTALNVNTGLYGLLDKNRKEIMIPFSSPTDSDQVILGTFDPEYFGGFENTIEWRNWQFQFMFQFVKQMGIQPIFRNSNVPGIMINQPTALLNRWVTTGDDALYPKFSQNGSSIAARTWGYLNDSELAFTDASYIRLKTTSLTYTLPRQWFKKLGLKKCNIYLLGQNLLTFTNFIGNDPETWESTFSLPPLKTIAVGLQATF